MSSNHLRRKIEYVKYFSTKLKMRVFKSFAKKNLWLQYNKKSYVTFSTKPFHFKKNILKSCIMYRKSLPSYYDSPIEIVEIKSDEPNYDLVKENIKNSIEFKLSNVSDEMSMIVDGLGKIHKEASLHKIDHITLASEHIPRLRIKYHGQSYPHIAVINIDEYRAKIQEYHAVWKDTIVGIQIFLGLLFFISSCIYIRKL